MLSRSMIGLLVTMLMVNGCASNITPISLQKPMSMNNCISDGTIKVCAEPCVTGDNQKLALGRDTGKDGVVPIRVIVENTGDDPVSVNPSEISLVLPDGEKFPNQDAQATSDYMISYTSRIVFGAVMLGVVGGLAAWGAVEAEKKNRLKDFKQLELKSVTLNKNESAQGYLFFIIEYRIRDCDSALMQVHLKPLNSSDSSNLELALKDLKYTPAQQEERIQRGFTHQ